MTIAAHGTDAERRGGRPGRMQGPRPLGQRLMGAPRAWLMLALVVPVAGWVLFEAQRVFRAEWASLAARDQVAEWSSTDQTYPNEKAWETARASLQAGLARTPDDPSLHERLGDLHAVAGRRDWDNKDKRRKHYQQAATHYEAALALRPGAAEPWAGLAIARQALEVEPARVHEAWNQALKRGPHEGHVQPLLLQVVLSQWALASPAMQDWAKTLFDKSDAATQAQINVLAKYNGLVFTPDPPAKAP